ncbi:hypothetical protein [Miltoncostaea oceani]|uniref:hypothetical protein n=1 Tax=Miltoncostaea oceani TaxID=2843216 RepID=UPI001C3D1A36|nr:hypothetical protein [Miltoncostaea oceani]
MGAAAGAPSAPAPVVAAPGEVCSPASAWIETRRGDYWLSSPSVSCFSATGAIFADGPLLSPVTPRLILEVGEVVRVHFSAAPQSVVSLLATTPARLRSGDGRNYRLSPFETRWKVRAGSGILRIATTEVVTPPGPSMGARVSPTFQVAAYRAVSDRR